MPTITFKVLTMQLNQNQFRQQSVIVEPNELYIEVDSDAVEEKAHPNDPDFTVQVLNLETLRQLQGEIDAVMVEGQEVKQPKYATNVSDFS